VYSGEMILIHQKNTFVNVHTCAVQVEAEYRAALNKGNVGKVAVSNDPQAKAIVEGFRM